MENKLPPSSHPAKGFDAAETPAVGKTKIKPGSVALSREEEAKLVLEHTVITPAVAKFLCLVFLLTIVSVPTIQLVTKLRGREPVLPAINASTFVPQAKDLHHFEGQLESDSIVAKAVLPHVQNILVHLGVGTENSYMGREGWLAYSPDFNYVTGPGFLEPAQLHKRSLEMDGNKPVQSDPIPAILHFKAQLAKRHIRLVLLPTPLKPMLEPQHFASEYGSLDTPLQNPSYAEFLRQMRDNHIMVCDPTQALFQVGQHSGKPQFLRTDTHWTPAGMQTTAALLGSFINQFSPLPPQRAEFTQHQISVSGRGDLSQMLKLPSAQSQAMFPPQNVDLEEVLTPEGKPWHSSSQADLLLLGDSFTNIYSREAMGWGSGAGLGEQLSYQLKRPLDVIGINAGGSVTTRRRLRDELLREPGRLSHTRLVIWQFAMRDLQSGNWPLINLPLPATSIAATRSSSKLSPSSAAIKARFRRAITEKVVQFDTKSAKKTQSPVLDGSRGWMFYLSDARYVTDHAFLDKGNNPQVEALLDFKRQLARRGIRLIFMPVPAKATIYPEMLGLAHGTLPLGPQNPSFGRFRKELEAGGIEVFDPTGSLLRQKNHIHAPLYMPTDSHWTFTGMENTAARLAEQIKPQMTQLSPAGYTRRPVQVANITDISYMLQGQPGNPQGMLLQQTVQQVQTPGGEVWKPSPAADILVMGDSFTNIYSHGGDWGKGAGFAEQLSYHLQRPVDLIAMDSGGINDTRRELQHEIQQGRDRLAGKKIVIYEVAARYLMRRDWDLIPLPAVGEAVEPTSEPFIAPPISAVTVRATIKERSEVPDAATTPYPDLVMSLHLTDVQVVGSQSVTVHPQDLLVYSFGLRKALPTKAASWKVGQVVTLRLTPWRRVEGEYGSYNRTELSGDSDALLDAYWGVEDNQSGDKRKLGPK